MKTVEILLNQKYEITLSEMGFDENDDIDNEAVLYEQGYNTSLLQLCPGDEFTIGHRYENGCLDNSEDKYKLILKNNKEEYDGENDEWEEENRNSESIIFYQGNYILNEDGITFEKI